MFLGLLLLGGGKGFAVEPVYRIDIDDYIIHPITAEYIERTIDRAEKENAQAVLIVLDTPGGLLQSTRQIVKKILNANVPVIVYVAPEGARAASAGVFITMAAHLAAMAPSTHIGAAHPIQLGETEKKGFLKKIKEKFDSEDEEGAKEPKTPIEKKILEDTISWAKNIAQKRNRNENWIQAAVEKSTSNTAEEAITLRIIDKIAIDTEDLMEKIDGMEVALPKYSVQLETKDATVIQIPLNWRQKILNVLINPNIAYILLTLGFYGLLFEITHPGSWAPGIAGLICMLLAFYSFNVIPTDFAGIVLTVVGLILLGLEFFVTSYGFMVLGGLLCLFFGALFLVDVPADYVKLSLKVAIPTIAAALGIFGMLFSLVLKSHRRRVVTGREGMIGLTARAQTDIAPTGKIVVRGELWNATSAEPIKKGEEVKILTVENLKIHVRKKPA